HCRPGAKLLPRQRSQVHLPSGVQEPGHGDRGSGEGQVLHRLRDQATEGEGWMTSRQAAVEHSGSSKSSWTSDESQRRTTMSVRIDVTHGFGNVDIQVQPDGYLTITDQIRDAVEAVGRALKIPMTVVEIDG